MKEPTYKPDQWIAFESNTLNGFGQIVGGTYDDGWYYTVRGLNAHGNLASVPEADIVYLLQNGSWLAPSHFGGRGSIYSDSSEVEQAMQEEAGTTDEPLEEA
jgi:hypothetical protein